MGYSEMTTRTTYAHISKWSHEHSSFTSYLCCHLTSLCLCYPICHTRLMQALTSLDVGLWGPKKHHSPSLSLPIPFPLFFSPPETQWPWTSVSPALVDTLHTDSSLLGKMSLASIGNRPAHSISPFSWLYIPYFTPRLSSTASRCFVLVSSPGGALSHSTIKQFLFFTLLKRCAEWLQFCAPRLW